MYKKIKVMSTSCFLILFSAVLFAQPVELKVGNDYSYKNQVKVINSIENVVKLKEFEDRLLILDFFATSCGSCIEAIPKYNELQIQFGSSIQILPVTGEKMERVQTFFNKNATVQANKLPIAFGDIELKQFFPHQGVPHVVWIYKGQVKAITAGDMVTERYIKEILNDQDVSNWPQKDDYYNTNVSLRESTADYNISSAILPYINGAKLSYSIDTLSTGFIRDRMVNVPLVTAYVYAFSTISELPLMKKERIILEVDDRFSFEKPDSVVQSIWEQEHAISYESILPVELPEKERMKRIVADLNNKLGLCARLEERSAQVWIVQGIDAEKIVKQDEKQGTQPLALKLGLLEVMHPSIPPLILEEVDPEVLVSIKGSDNFEVLKEQFLKNGLDLLKGSRKIQTLVISK